MAKSKIYIKPSKRGTFTAAAKRRGMGVQGFASKVLANKGNYSPAMVKKANFARNASKWKKELGGYLDQQLNEIPIENTLMDNTNSLVKYGVGGWMGGSELSSEEKVGDAFGNIGGAVSAIPVIGTIAGPILKGIGGIIGKSGEKKRLKEEEKEQERARNTMMQIGAARKGLADKPTIQYGATFQDGGDLTLPNPEFGSTATRFPGSEIPGVRKEEGVIPYGGTKLSETFSKSKYRPITDLNYQDQVERMYDIDLEGFRDLPEDEINQRLRSVVGGDRNLPFTVTTNKKGERIYQKDIGRKTTDRFAPEGTGEIIESIDEPIVGFQAGGMLMDNIKDQQKGFPAIDEAPVITEYDGNSDTHAQGIGGVPVDAKGNPAMTSKQSAVGMTEKGEVTWNGYVFSNKLKI